MTTLTAARLSKYRAYLHDSARLAIRARTPGKSETGNFRQLGKFEAYRDALYILDEMLADVVTISLVESKMAGDIGDHDVKLTPHPLGL